MGVIRSCRQIPVYAALTAALLVVTAVPAAAAPLLFNFTGGETGIFRADSTPIPNYIDANSFGTPITDTTGVFAGAGGAEFYLGSGGGGGGLALYAGPGSSVFIGLEGPQLFSGSLSSPTFAPGYFHLRDASSGAATNLNVIAPGAPAPQLGTGLLAGAASLAALALTRRRRTRRAS